ncbi:MAG: hypothetical protein EPO22_02920, partial [Dehalococcoidia bacterium]
MIARVRAFVFSFQTKLVLAVTSVIILALFLAGSVFVVRTRNERRNQALDRVAAASPAIYQQALYALLPQEEDERPFAETIDDLAKEQDVRILLINNDGIIAHDTGGGELNGATIQIPPSTRDDLQRGFIAWQPTGDIQGHNLTFVAASSGLLSTRGRATLPFRIVLVVKTDTIASAWVGLLPGLGLAA